jgi:two-component system, OmpR family, response regulator
MTDSPIRLLVVDDEVSIREPLGEYLGGQGYAVDLAANAADARSKLLGGRYALVICDIMMPGEDGLSLTRHIRDVCGLPVILLTARSEETERVIGLEIGADDYVAKPFGPRELVARIRAVLRRVAAEPRVAAPDDEDSYRFADWLLSSTTRTLTHSDGHEVALSTGEYQLLLAFLRHPRAVMSRDRLLDLVRGREADVFDRSIDNLVSRLRRKIEADPRDARLIRTIWGGGYSLATEVRRIAPGAGNDR